MIQFKEAWESFQTHFLSFQTNFLSQFASTSGFTEMSPDMLLPSKKCNLYVNISYFPFI